MLIPRQDSEDVSPSYSVPVEFAAIHGLQQDAELKKAVKQWNTGRLRSFTNCVPRPSGDGIYFFGIASQFLFQRFQFLLESRPSNQFCFQ